MTYDSVRGKVVMFGGYVSVSGTSNGIDLIIGNY
jgi:hypothetical protein